MSGNAAPTEPAASAQVLTVPEVAWVLRLSIPTVYKRLNAGDLASYKDGRKRLVTREQVEAYLARMSGAGGKPARRREKAA